MIRLLLRVAAWLAIGSMAVGALYWAFLNTPESRATTLTLSAALVFAIVVVAAVVVNVAVLLASGEPLSGSLGRGLRCVHCFLLAAVPMLLIAYAITGGDGWVAERSGEISAWFIATLGWADVTWLFRVEGYISRWLRWVVLPAGALGALGGMLAGGAGALARTAWTRAAWNWRTLVVATVAFVLLIELPWRAARWQPAGLPSTWVEPALAGVRLLLIGGATAIGAAIVLVTIARASHRQA